jgi:hypothetical protein
MQVSVTKPPASQSERAVSQAGEGSLSSSGVRLERERSDQLVERLVRGVFVLFRPRPKLGSGFFLGQADASVLTEQVHPADAVQND